MSQTEADLPCEEFVNEIVDLAAHRVAVRFGWGEPSAQDLEGYRVFFRAMLDEVYDLEQTRKSAAMATLLLDWDDSEGDGS